MKIEQQLMGSGKSKIENQKPGLPSLLERGTRGEAVKSLIPIVKNYKGKIKIMMDSGLRSGPNVARTLVCGADFTFMGRSFMYSVAALGNRGGEHIISI